jgi:hypothetical protein
MPSWPSQSTRAAELKSRYAYLEVSSCGAVLRKEGLEFDIRYPYSFCRICGIVFQSSRERSSDNRLHVLGANTELRRQWSVRHARTHTDTEHRQLAASGRFVTPEAAERLVTYGIAPVSDMALNGEHEHAAIQASNRPKDDAES